MIGTGYVGLVSGTCFADIGNQVICVDKDKNKIDKLNSGISPIYEPGLTELLKKNINAGRLSFTYDIKKATRDSEIIFIAVGTPEGRDGKSDRRVFKLRFKLLWFLKFVKLIFLI